MFQNGHEEFDEFWPGHSKTPKLALLMGFFWTKLFWVRKKLQGSFAWWHWKLMQHLKENWLEEFSKFSPEHVWKSKNWNFDGILLSKRRKFMSWKFTGEICVITMKNDTKFEEELTFQFKIDTRNLTDFDPSTWKSQKSTL